jgi:hypothetical protein
VLIHCPNHASSNAVDESGVGEDEKMNGEIVSSVRIFRRTLSTGGSSGGGDAWLCVKRFLNRFSIDESFALLSYRLLKMKMQFSTDLRLTSSYLFYLSSSTTSTTAATLS